jgi:hypothetical protein
MDGVIGRVVGHALVKLQYDPVGGVIVERNEYVVLIASNA